jgi:hypothetical protein
MKVIGGDRMMVLLRRQGRAGRCGWIQDEEGADDYQATRWPATYQSLCNERRTIGEVLRSV